MINNASKKNLSEQNSVVPNVQDVVQPWLSTINAEVVTSTVVNGDIAETITPVTFKGMLQSQSSQELQLHPEGERSWDWINIYCDFADFKLDDIVISVGVKYRIRSKQKWQDLGYGYYLYEAVRDYDEHR